MAELHWTSYVAMGTGIVGAITGIFGAIMGYVSYKKASSLKSLDLRLELRKALHDQQVSLSQLQQRIEEANRSRKAVSAKTGHGGAFQKWKQGMEADKTLIEQLSKSAPSTEDEYDNLTHKELESELVEVHRLQVQIDKLLEKYDAAIQADDEERRQTRADLRKRTEQIR